MKHEKSDFNLQRRISGVNWNQVYYFSLVAAHGSIKNASEVLQLSSSTLSEHISQLEAALDTKLFIRKGPKLFLTEAGQKLARHAKQMFENGQRILDVVSPLKLGCYPVSIGVVPGPHLFTAHRKICDYAEKYGPVDLKISQWSFDELESGLVEKLDFAFADRPSKRRDIRSECLSSSYIRFFVAEKWRDQSLRDVLKKIPLLICQSEAATDTFLENALEKVDIYPCSIVRGEYPSVLKDLCRRGLGVGAFSEDAVEKDGNDWLRSLQNPREAPKIETKTFVLWSVDAENTLAVSHIRELIEK